MEKNSPWPEFMTLKVHLFGKKPGTKPPLYLIQKIYFPNGQVASQQSKDNKAKLVLSQFF